MSKFHTYDQFYLRIEILFVNLHDVMKTVGGAKSASSRILATTTVFITLRRLKIKFQSLYTMQNKFSKCFVWVSPSTSDLIVHFLA